MNYLSFTQEYFLCAVNSKGEIPILSTSDIAACLVAGGIMELVSEDFIERDEKKRFIIVRPWDGSLPYLKPLYDSIASSKKGQGAGVVGSYAFSFTDKPLRELVAAFRSSLSDAGCLDEVEDQGLVKAKTRYIPKPEVVTGIIEKIRAEFLENGVISEDVLCLAVLLSKTSLIRNYFSKVEASAMKQRIKEVRASEAYASVKDIFDYVEAVAAIIVIASAT